MFVSWHKKKMRFNHHGKRITLKGLKSIPEQCLPISAHKLQHLIKKGQIEQVIQLLCSVTVDQEHTNIPPAVQQLLTDYKVLFQDPQGLPPSRQFDHTIPLLPDAQPVNQRPYRISPQLKDELEKQVTEMLHKGFIQHSSSPFASPVLLVKKKEGTWRFCVDYRRLNTITVKNKYPLPIVEELLDELAGAQWFTKLDLRSGYHQIKMAPQDVHKTAFRVHNGHYEFLVMPFGLTGAPASFQGTMNTIFQAEIRRYVLVFVDDILIYSPTLEEHIQHIQHVFDTLQKNNFFVKLSKCSFAQQKLEYLGHIIGKDGVATDDKKIEEVKNWPTPKTLKQVRSFLGLAGYYRRFIRNYGLMSKPLTDLLKKNSTFKWTPTTAQAFEAVKQALISAPVLQLPNFSKQFIIETDASHTGIGAVLMQEGHPIAFLSKALCSKSQAMSAYEKECLAVLMAVDRWRSYLQHHEFIIRTDHQSLAHLSEQRLTTSVQHKAFVKLMGLQYKIQYKKGTLNQAADALSRKHAETALNAITSCVPTWISDLIAGYDDDPTAKRLLVELAIHPDTESTYTLQEGVLRYKGRVYVGTNKLAQQHILQALHASGLGGHSGSTATYQQVKNLFAWPQLKQTVDDFVRQCSVCQQAKSEHTKLPGLLEPLQAPTEAWQLITMDFIEGLPKSNGFDSILVVVDKFSKYSHFLPLKHPFTALQVAQSFFDNVYKLHGMPGAIVSDRDPIFTSQFWQHLIRLSDTRLNMSSARHPQTDGQTERVNQCLETFLRCFVNSCPHKWHSWLALAEFWYNTTYHSTLQKTPFQVLYGHQPR